MKIVIYLIAVCILSTCSCWTEYYHVKDTHAGHIWNLKTNAEVPNLSSVLKGKSRLAIVTSIGLPRKHDFTLKELEALKYAECWVGDNLNSDNRQLYWKTLSAIFSTAISDNNAAQFKLHIVPIYINGDPYSLQERHLLLLEKESKILAVRRIQVAYGWYKTIRANSVLFPTTFSVIDEHGKTGIYIERYKNNVTIKPVGRKDKLKDT